MHYFTYQENELFCEGVSLQKIANIVGTPCYIYSARTLRHYFKTFRDSLKFHDHLICYSVKANSNLSVLKLLAEMGAGFDIVSQGELFRVLKANGDPQKIVFSGVGKTKEEMREGLKNNILCFNVESFEELELLNHIAKGLDTKAPVSLRVNPNINPKTHPYISTGLRENKFGIPISQATLIYKNASRYPNIEFMGLDCHIGSQMLTLDPIIETLKELKKLILTLKQSSIHIQHLNLGGGLGIRYKQESPPSPKEYIREILKYTKDLRVKLLFEPGRTVVGHAGILLTQILYTKKVPHKTFFIVDAAMNDLIRPALYDAYQDVWPVIKSNQKKIKADVVGPICESSDFLAKDRRLPAMSTGDLLSIMSCGAYGFSMSSNYNSRRKPAEVLVDGKKISVCRKRETYDDLIRGEKIGLS